VSVFSWHPAPLRFAAKLNAWLAAAALAFLLAALLATLAGAPVADARGPGGGYYDVGDGNGKSGDGLKALWSAARAPLRWLRQSTRSFQTLMLLLAARSARQWDPDAPPPLASKRPHKEAVEEFDEPPRRSIYGGEAGAGPDQGGVRVKEWHKRATKAWPEAPPSSCRRAGVPVRRGGWYVVQRGDTLWRIAEIHYGYGEAYPRLRRANSAGVPDANLIYPCQRLYIPRWRCCGFSDRTEAETPVAYDDGEDDGGQR
jgi:hypothetical protein